MTMSVNNSESIIFKTKKIPVILSLLFAVGFIGFGIYINTNYHVNEESEINGLNLLSFGIGICLLFMIYFLSRKVTLTQDYLKIGIKKIPWEIIKRIGERDEKVNESSENNTPENYNKIRKLFILFHEKTKEYNNSRTIKPNNYKNGSIIAEEIISRHEKFKPGKIKETVE